MLRTIKKQLHILILVVSLVSSILAQTKEARKIDEFGSIPCEELRARLDSFLSELQNNPQTKGFVIVYEGKYFYPDFNKYPPEKIKTYLPAFGEAQLRTQAFINHFKWRNFPSDRYLFISGGYREKHTVEFWIVPNGAKPLRPSPTLDKMKFRKGKPERITCEEG